MKQRIITAVVAVLIFIPILVFSYTPVFPIAMALLSVIAVYEMTKCIGIEKKLTLIIPSAVLGLVLPLLPWLVKEEAEGAVIALCIVYMVFILASSVLSRGKLMFEDSAATFFTVFYIAVSFTCIVSLRNVHDYTYLLVFVGPWVSDTFAYLFGIFFGKHKLIPEVSPKKTVEGSIAGIVCTMIGFVLFAVIVNRFFAVTYTDYVIMALSGGVVSVVSQIGDLSASVIKRRYNVKDYGYILPGHGGIMDRFDSVLLTAPVLYVITELTSKL